MNSERNDENLQMFLISFAVLFFELVCIRWFPAHIRHLGYFTNFILLAVFLGMGIGIIAPHRGRDRSLLFLPVLGAVLVLVHFFRVQIRIPAEEVVCFQGSKFLDAPVEPFYMIPVLFFLVSLLVALLASPMGRLFKSMEPLTAYRSNILGSLAGIALFSLLSWLRFPPWVWMLVLSVIFLLFHRGRDLRGLLVQGVMASLVIAGFALLDGGSLWSPYNRITVRSGTEGGPKAYALMVNNTGHQMMRPVSLIDREPIYGEMYRHFPPSRFRKILIVGSGAGDDAAYALAKGVGAIDAVEIDPVILELGKRLHPENPYRRESVKLFTADARTYFKNSLSTYDCIIFALTDSMVLSSSYASLRLESYLYTVQSFREAARLLKPDGIIVLYNYYRTEWLIDRMASTLEIAFGYPPAVYVYPPVMACFITGPGSRELKRATVHKSGYPATDDWPFIYLRRPSIPSVYGKTILAVILIASIFFFSATGGRVSLNASFFFLGAAFMLVEAKSVVTFSLLFGPTWAVNAVVFSMILLLSLLALHLTERFSLKGSALLYGALLLVIGLNYLVPPGTFSGAPPLLRWVAAPIFYLLPVFLAGLVFTSQFRDSWSAAIAFSSSCLGGILGGMTEYLSMVMGCNNLLLFVALFYLAAWHFYGSQAPGGSLSRK